MAWMMSANEVLKENITKINFTMEPPGFMGDVRKFRSMQETLAYIIDDLGEQSAAAQGLNKTITTAEKLRNSPTHLLYLLKDPTLNNGAGQVTGFLKVGRKKLFLFDRHDQVREVEPLCVLDFYVQRDKQRRGLGKQLFDHMIQDMNVKPNQLAIDGPSPKMMMFLQRNYGISELCKQANNFAVAPEFFQETTDSRAGSGRNTPSMPTAGVGRYTAARPATTIGAVIHGGGDSAMNIEPYRAATPELKEGERAAAGRPSSLTWQSGESHMPRSAPRTPPPPPVHHDHQEADNHQHQGEDNFDHQGEDNIEHPVSENNVHQVENPMSPRIAAGTSDSRRDLPYTDQGFFDIKFFHNKLW